MLALPAITRVAPLMVECPIAEPGVKSIGKLTTMQGAGVSRHCTADAAAAPPESGGLVAPPAGRPGLWANGQISVQCQGVEWVIEDLNGSQRITKELQAIHVHLLVLNTPGPAIMDTRRCRQRPVQTEGRQGRTCTTLTGQSLLRSGTRSSRICSRGCTISPPAHHAEPEGPPVPPRPHADRSTLQHHGTSSGGCQQAPRHD